MRTFTQRLQQVLALVLTIAALAVGQSAWATTKTVTYTITSVESINLNYDIVFTRSGDAPFDASQTTYTATVSTSIFGQTSGGAGGFSVELADGFKLDLQWGSGSNVQFITENCIIPRASGKYITYTVSCPDTYYYYTTHVMMTGTESGFQHGMPQTYPGSGSIDTDYDSVWGFSGKYYSSYSFGQLTVTYSDAPALSIFESPSTDTYNIKDKYDLRHLANYVNNGGNDCQGLAFLQTQDITYTHTTTWNDASSTENNYTAIGTDDHRFCGTFDGQNHTISGIRIYKPNYNGQGLFGYIKGGTVRGVNLADARITGYSYVGGIAGIIFSATVEDCFVVADACIHAVKSSSSYHGGIVGDSQGNTVQRCLSRASLTVAQNATSCKYYGAIIGENSTIGHAVKDCIAIGATVPNISNYRGAIIGDNNNNNSTYVQRNYYRACSVAGVENATGVGVGYDDNTNSPHDLTDNQGAQALYSLTLPSGVTLVRTASATLPGTGNKTYTTGADIDGTPYAYATATLSLSYDAAAIPDGYDVLLSVTQTVSGDAVSFTDHGDHTYTISSMPAADITITATAAPISWEGEGTGTEDDPYQISSYAELKQFANIVNGTGGEAYTYASAKLVNDIVCKNSFEDTEFATDWVPIGNASHPYVGTFDGDYYTIFGLSTPTDNASDDVGLFGYIGSYGVVKDVILEYATMTGNSNVGVVAGHNDGTLTDNFYLSCSANDATANIGTGSGDCDGARGLFTITLPEGATASAATITLDYTDYYATGTTVTLSYSGTPPEGFAAQVVYSLNGTTIDSNTFTMPAEDVTVSARWAVPYIDADGSTKYCRDYTVIDPSKNHYGNKNSEDWYVVCGTVNMTYLGFGGPAHVILCDGASLTLSGYEGQIEVSHSLTIYGQSEGTGSITANSEYDEENYDYGIGIKAGAFTLCGGNITLTGDICGLYAASSLTVHRGSINATGSYTGNDVVTFGDYGGAGICSEFITINGGTVVGTGGNVGIYQDSSRTGNFTINGGSVSGTGTNDKGIQSFSSIIINGGQVSASGGSVGLYSDYDMILGCSSTSDYITATSFGTFNGDILVKDGQTLTDGTDIYSGTLTTEQINAIAGKTLQLVDATVLRDNADNTDAIAIAIAADGNPCDVVLHGRTLYRDGTWNTLCLPFDVTIEGSVLDGADARALNSTSLSNGLLSLNFSTPVDALVAGTPYIIRWVGTSSGDLVNPTFEDVTISDAGTTIETDYVDFIGTYAPVNFTEDDATKLFVGADNKLYYPLSGAKVNAFRGYFQLKDGLTIGDSSNPRIRSVVLNTDGDDPTSIKDLNDLKDSNDLIYNLAGQRLSKTRKGINIVGGRKVIRK